MAFPTTPLQRAKAMHLEFFNKGDHEGQRIMEAAISALSEKEPSVADTYVAKIERDAATMKVLRMLLREAFDFLNAQVIVPEDYDDWEKRYKAFTESLDRIAAGVAFVTDTRLGGD